MSKMQQLIDNEIAKINYHEWFEKEVLKDLAHRHSNDNENKERSSQNNG